MKQKQGSRRARRRAELRTRILGAAFGLFARQGFSSTTVEQITKAADVGKGTFFNYFPTKEHVAAGFGEMQVARVRAALGAARQGKLPIRKILLQLSLALAEQPGRSPALVRSLLAANLSNEALSELMRRNLGRGRRFLAKLMALGQQRGELRRDCKPGQIARLWQQAFLGAVLLWAFHLPSKLRRSFKATSALLWSGIAAGKQARRKKARRR